MESKDRNRSFVFYENFWASIEGLPIETQKEVCYAIAKYGIEGEMVSADEFPVGAAMVQAFKFSLDKSKKRSEGGISGGRPESLGEEELVRFLMENKGVTSKEVAEVFGVSDTTIRRKEAWKNRQKIWSGSIPW